MLFIIRMTRPVSFFCIVTIVLELYRRKWQGGNMYYQAYTTKYKTVKMKTKQFEAHFLYWKRKIINQML